MLTLVLNDRPGNRYALNVLAGAVETSLPEVRLAPAATVDDALGVAGGALAQGGAVVMAWSFASIDFAARRTELGWFRQQCPHEDVLHVAGGPHPSAEPAATVAAGFDVAVVGEGEAALIALLRGRLRGASLSGLEGLSSRPTKGGLVLRATAPVELDDFPPFPTRLARFNPIEITRGCAYACKFCQTPFLFKARLRHRSVEAVRQYVSHLRGRELFDQRFITPSALSYGSTDERPNLPAVEALLEATRSALGPGGRIFYGTFPSELRPEQVTPAALRLLRRHVANRSLLIGAQSGSDRLLAACGRGHDVQEVRAAVRYAVEAGFQPEVDLIFGMPGETEADLDASFALADELAARGARIHAHLFMPLPGTPWRRAAPARLSPRALQRLGAMTAAGTLHGQWQRHGRVAHRLAGQSAGETAGETGSVRAWPYFTA